MRASGLPLWGREKRLSGLGLGRRALDARPAGRHAREELPPAGAALSLP